MTADGATGTASLADCNQSGFEQWFPLADLEQALAAEQPSVPACRDFLKSCQQQLEQRFETGTGVEQLVHARSWLVDRILVGSWKRVLGKNDNALVAVGGYGRNELLPGSDVDLLILLADSESDTLKAQLETLLTLLWDIGLEVGHSVRTLDDCTEQAENDITVATNLMEARLLTGPDALFEEMRRRTGPEYVWPTNDFFAAKLEEQQQRYQRFDDAVYNLEPNVKEGPGGLRDAQMIGWVMKRHFGLNSLQELVDRDYITQDEYRTLIDGQQFLWKVRFGLHLISGRREDRLLFDHQRTLAEKFGYTAHDHKLAVEWFMKDYYLTIMELNRLNEMLLQLLQEIILYADDPGEPRPIGRRFQVRKGFLEVVNEGVFSYYPFALLELFLIMQQHPEIKGVQASTIRLVRSHTHLIDDEFRNDLRARSLFMEIFRQHDGLTHELRRMNRYGVLAAYYPAFAHIVGQMQHDLFHAYTVDEHTLFVVRNLRRFAVPEHANELPLCSRIAETIPKLELLYLAGFFHDIGKGRGGNHSDIGADEAFSFLQKHQLSDFDCKLVAWLVRNHLQMSSTAQKRDISDPEVINEFARHVGDQTRLDYLYLLTVADIRGTNPGLWNTWRDSLLKDLYNATRRALRRGLGNPLLREEQIKDVKSAALEQLADSGIDRGRIETLWADFPEDYFLRHNAGEVKWHVNVILQPGHAEGARIDLRNNTRRGSGALFVYTPIISDLFTRTTALLDQLGLSIIDARIITSSKGYAIDTFSLLNADDKPLIENWQVEQLIERMQQELELDEPPAPSIAARISPRRIRQFQVATKVFFHLDESTRRTIIDLITTDSPGLLFRVSQIFHSRGVVVHNARIATSGAQAEDVFYVTSKSGGPLSSLEQEELRTDLVETLDDIDQ